MLLQEAQCKQAEVADRELLAKTTSDKESLRKEALRCRDTVILAARTITETELLGVKSTKSVVHERAAMRLLELCRKNGGIYVKLGQHIAQVVKKLFQMQRWHIFLRKYAKGMCRNR